MKSQDSNSCFICLEDTQDPKPQIVSCACQFRCHTTCWQNYITTKGRCECPYCHTVFMANPLVHVIVIQPNEVEEYGEVGARRRIQYNRIGQGCMGFLMLWILIIIIWEWAA